MNKITVITGASGGIGAALARQLGQQGHRLVLGARREKELKEVADATGQAKAITPHFMQRGAGHLINVSSFLSRVPFVSFRSAYNAAKAALNALTSNLRADLARTHPGIHVSLVMPGVVKTDFQRNARGATPTLRVGAGTDGQTADEAAAAIVRLIEQPVAEIYTNPALAQTVVRYFQDVGAFEAQWGRRD